MKSILKIAAAACLLLSTAAFADTLGITSVTESVQPAAKMTSNANNAFNPGREKIVFKALGKTCTLNSSGNPWNAGGGAGCNYSVTIDVSTQTMTLTSNDKGCTTAAEFASSCQ
jgi:hypothetical protein